MIHVEIINSSAVTAGHWVIVLHSFVIKEGAHAHGSGSQTFVEFGANHVVDSAVFLCAALYGGVCAGEVCV